MQGGIPVAYNVCEVKLDQINHWICVHREKYIKTQSKSRISYQVCKNTESSDCIWPS